MPHRLLRTPSRAFALLLGLVGVAACSGELPLVTHVDRLRVLAVRAEPPEVRPEETAVLDTLTALPPRAASVPAPAVSYRWFACAPAAGANVTFPCPLRADLPDCAVERSGAPCVIGDTPVVRYAPPEAALGGGDRAELLLTVVVADEQAGGAAGCAAEAGESGAPGEPEHCVIAIKRLAVRRAGEPNHNPTLESFTLDGGALRDGGRGDAGALPRSGAIAVSLAPGAAERRPDGRYEPLYVSWFASAGRFDSARTSFQPADCAERCQRSEPPRAAGTRWNAPEDEDEDGARRSSASGEVRFWVVVRDERGGVGWLSGVAGTPPLSDEAGSAPMAPYRSMSLMTADRSHTTPSSSAWPGRRRSTR